MKGKKTYVSLMVIMLLVGIIPGALAGFVGGTGLATKINLWDAANPGAAPVLYPDLQEYIELNDTYAVGATFTVYANVTNVNALNMYAVGVEYNPAILDVLSFSEGSPSENFFYLNVPPAAYGPVVNQPIPASGAGGPMFGGDWEHITWALVKPYNASGTGILAKFEFSVVGWGFTYIDIMIAGAQVATLADPTAPPDINYNTIDIIFDNMGIAPPPYPPTSVFTVTPPAPRYVDQVLTFTGKNTSAEWGFSGAPLFVYYPIVLFEWDFGDTNFDTGKVVTHAYTSDGTFTANLTVTDSNGGKDWSTQSITIFPLAVGAVLDVYTQQPVYNGTGPFFPSRPYRANKEELVILYAKVIYNNCPVANKLVTFAVYFATGAPPTITFTPVVVRTAFTDANGIATIDYRVPLGYPNASSANGAYLVYAYCFIAQGLVADALTYRVEWVNEIVSVVPLAPQSWHKCETAVFNVTIIGWDFVTGPLIISLYLEDDLNTSIALTVCGPAGRPPQYPAPCNWWTPTRTFFGDGTQLGLYGEYYIGPGTAWYLISAHIPMNAYVGVGTAYVNIFDAWPIPDQFAEPQGLQGDGQPWGPEMTTAFGIEC